MRYRCKVENTVREYGVVEVDADSPQEADEAARREWKQHARLEPEVLAVEVEEM